LAQILVRLLGEPVDVWRPVVATELGEDRYEIDDQPVPDDERWEFEPGATVMCEPRRFDCGPALVAIRRSPDSQMSESSDRLLDAEKREIHI
jgi:hypothetical protein